MSLRLWWRDCLPALSRHDKPWIPELSTLAPHQQLWGIPVLQSSRRQTAIRTSSSDSLRPHAMTGRAFSQSPLRGALTAKRWALSLASVSPASNAYIAVSMTERRNPLTKPLSSPTDTITLFGRPHLIFDNSNTVYNAVCHLVVLW